MKRSLPFLIILALAIAGAAAGTAIYRSKKAEIAAAAAPVLPAGTTGEPGAKPPHVQGPAQGATVVLEEFGDFQCPPCGGLAVFLRELEQEHASKLAVIFRQFPLPLHKFAMKAADASEAAAAQGRFWEMHRLIYDNQSTWSTSGDAGPLFESYAKQIGLDLDRYRADIEAPGLHDRVLADQSRGRSLGVTGTPAVFINDERVPPASLNEGALRHAVEVAIKGKKPIFDSANETKSTPSPSP
ncbi:MAG: DsbA family protein [Verrucomicrobiota bacterium]|nr:DsbA family protein [Verrucomicrobiota bacterium]